MTTFKLRYVDSYTDRLGVLRHYFRRGRGTRTALDGVPGSETFMAGYAEALAASEPRTQSVQPRGTPAEGTVAHLARLYYSTPKFKKLAPSSKINYRAVLDRFCDAHGTKRVANLRYQHIAKIIGDMSDRPGAAIVLLKRIRTMLQLAVKLGWIVVNPASGVETYDSVEYHTLTEAEIAQYETRWPLGTRERLAFDTILYTGQRVSDAHVMPRPDALGKMRVVQQKSQGKTVLVIRAHQNLVASIAACAVSHTVINVTAYGQPFSTKGFSQFVSAAMRTAGLSAECVPHGLRKSAARRLAEIGCSPHQIMALTGHRTLAEVERYTRAADQERLNDEATTKQEARG